VSAEIFDARCLFHAKRVMQSTTTRTYEVVLLQDMSVAEFMHLLRHLPLEMSTQYSNNVIHKTTPPKDAA